MTHVVIIGAGSMGLYLAYKLRKEGIRSIRFSILEQESMFGQGMSIEAYFMSLKKS
jgi:cation diffusion facilitator CzcD-associated flavoprotein CzcO